MPSPLFCRTPFPNVTYSPEINFAVLPIQFNHASANITAAIVLRAEAGIGLQKTPLTQNIDFSAIASATLTLAEVTFGTVLTDGRDGACKQALFIDVDSSAAAEAVVGGELAGHEFEHGPDVSTVFLSAGTTTCLDQRRTDIRPPTTTTTPSSKPPPALPGCPTSALVTATRNVTKTFSLTSCLVSAINCPASLTQVIVVTDIQPTTTISCPPSFNITAPTTTVAPVAFYTAGSITLPPLASPVVTSIAPALLANVTAPVNATVAGVAVTVPVLTTPPPPPPERTATAIVNVGGKNGSGTSTVATGGATGMGSVGSALLRLVGVLVVVVVML